MLITSDGKRIESAGWKALEKTENKPDINNLNAGYVAGKTLDPNYELVINLELAEIQDMRVHRPYVAIWVVDKDKKPVRSIALWYKKPKYLDDMNAWYDAYYKEFMDANSSISSTTSATRPAGKYTLKWDGKTDKGQMAALGTYTLMVEVAREHGTHQLMTKELDFSKKIKPVSLPANTEVAALSFDYVKKANGQ